jgi:hypothetical protein
MSKNQQPNPDLLEEAIEAFGRMTVPERPPDAEVLAQLDSPSKRRYFLPVLLSSAAAAVLLVGGLVLFLRNNSSPPESVQGAATASPGKADVLVETPFEQHVADAQVIVVATALDWAPAPPRRPGDLAEVLLRFQVKRVLKGKLTDQFITTRTPTAGDEFIGKDWVVLLSPEYLAGMSPYAGCVAVEFEPTVKACLPRDHK